SVLEHGEGRHGRFGSRRLDRHRDFAGAPTRRAAEPARREVQPHALRAVGLYGEPADPDGEVDPRLHLPLAGAEVLDAGAAEGDRSRGEEADDLEGARVAAGTGDEPVALHVHSASRRAALLRVRLDRGRAQWRLLQVLELRRLYGLLVS